MRGLRMKDLELFIQSIPAFKQPRVELEQYVTPSTLAARLLWIAETTYGDIAGRTVADLGAGTGRLGLGALLLGASEAVLVDVDGRVLAETCVRAATMGFGGRVECLVCDAGLPPLRRKSVDTVLQNPPFGVQRRGMDARFLEAAARLGGVIYSIHKAPTLRFIVRRSVELGCSPAKPLFRDRICIPPVFFFHTRRMHCVDIVAVRIVCKGV